MISVIMPVYNASKTLEKSIISVLRQKYSDFELILVNDGSVDNSGEICDKYAHLDSRVKVLHQDNAGVSVARNNGIELASRKYIMFIDSDDQYNMCMIQSMLREIESDNYDLVLCGYNKCFHNNWKVYSTTQVIPKSFKYKNKAEILDNVESLFNSSVFNCLWNKIYVTEIIKSNQIKMNTNISISEDFVFNLHYLNYCKKIKCVDEILYDYYIGNNYLTGKYYDDLYSMRKIKIDEWKKFYIINNMLPDQINYQYVKLAYACLMNLFHKDNKDNFRKKIYKINVIISYDEVSHALDHATSKKLDEKLLVCLMRTRSSILLYIFVYIMNKFYRKIRFKK